MPFNLPPPPRPRPMNQRQAARVSGRRQYVASLRAARPDVPWRVNVARQKQCQRRMRGDRGRFGADQAIALAVVANDMIPLADLEAACCYALQVCGALGMASRSEESGPPAARGCSEMAVLGPAPSSSCGWPSSLPPARASEHTSCWGEGLLGVGAGGLSQGFITMNLSRPC